MMRCAERSASSGKLRGRYPHRFVSIHNLIAVRIIVGYVVDAQSIISTARFCNFASRRIIFVVVEGVPPPRHLVYVFRSLSPPHRDDRSSSRSRRRSDSPEGPWRAGVASGAPDLVVVGVGRGTAVPSVRGLVIIEVGRGGTAAPASWEVVVIDVGRIGDGRGRGGTVARRERPRRH